MRTTIATNQTQGATIHAETMMTTGTPTADHHDEAGVKSPQAPHKAGVAPTITSEAIAMNELTGLLLNAAGIGEHDVRPIHEGAELAVLEGLRDHDVVTAGDIRQERLAHTRVAMSRQDEEGVRVTLRQTRDGTPYALHRLAPRLPPVRSDQDDPSLRVGQRLRQRRITRRHRSGDRIEKGVDHRVASDQDRGRIESLPQKIVPTASGRAQVQRGDLAEQAPIGLLREGRGDGAGAQAGLDVRDGHLVVERGQPCCESGGGVPLGEDDIGRERLDLLPHARERPRGHLSQ